MEATPATHSPETPQFTRVQIPWLVPAVLAAALVLWGLWRIVPDALAYTHGRPAQATVVKVAKQRASVWIDFEARTADAGTIRGSDMLIMGWPPTVGDRVEIAYLAVGRWRHAIVTSDRNWINPVFLPSVAIVFGMLLGTAAVLPARNGVPHAPRPQSHRPDTPPAARALHSF